MTKSLGKSFGFLAFAIAAVCTTACDRDRDRVGTTTTTSSEVELNTTPTPTLTIGHKDDYLATVRREQLVLRGRIEDELRNIDRRLGELRRQPHQDTKAVRELSEKRETLRADATVVSRADERGWDELKAVVEHDLQVEPQM